MKTTALPEFEPLESAKGAPQIAVLPSLDNATEKPKVSLAAPAEYVNTACSVHVLPLRVNTTALPASVPFALSSYGCPTIAVVPSLDNAQQYPN